MKNYFIKSVLGLCLFSPTFLFSQTLTIQDTGGGTSSFDLTNIRSIKFDVNNMHVFLNDGNFGTYDIGDIDFYKIEVEEDDDDTANLEENKLKEKVNVYPNPATDKLNIDFKSQVSGDITIEITDMTGRLIDQVYSGKHTDETFISWDIESKSIQSGQYLCVIKTKTGVISKPITLK